MKNKRRILSLLLAGTMVCSLFPQVVFAENVPAGGAPAKVGGECPHHTEHTAACGYREGAACPHEHTQDCYATAQNCAGQPGEGAVPSDADPAPLPQAGPHTCTEESGCITKELDCRHVHDENCGDTEGMPCTFDPAACTLCAPADGGLQEPCSCKDICTDVLKTPDCPVCGPADADLTACGGEKAAEKTCTCDPVVAGEGEHTSESCPLYGEKAPVCSCTESCIPADEEKGTDARINPDCPVCSAADADLTACGGAGVVLAGQPQVAGDFTVVGGEQDTDYRYAANTLTILTGTPLTISGTTTQDNIVVEDGVEANITLNNVEIAFRDGSLSGYQKGTCAFEVAGNASCKLTLLGTNALRSGEYKAGLQAQEKDGKKATLVITGESTGSLTAIGGSFGAGIGGSYDAGGNITILGGTITTGSEREGAGIGGGTVIHNNGTITISGGTVIANTGSTAGIGGTFSTTAPDGSPGNAFLYAKSIKDNGEDKKQTWSGMIFEAGSGRVYGSPTLGTDAEIPSGSTLEVPSGATLTVGSGVTLTNHGTIENNGTIYNHGVIGPNPPVGGALNDKKSRVELTLSSSQAAYGDTITITAKVWEDTAGFARTAKKVDFYIGEKMVGSADVEGAAAPYTAQLQVEIESANAAMGQNTITAKYRGGDAALLPSEGTAELEVLVFHTITATAGAGGSISPSGALRVADGKSQTFTIVPGSGYAVAEVQVDGVSKGKITNYTFPDVTADHTITAAFLRISGGFDGDDSPPSSTVPTPENPNPPTDGKTDVAGKVDGSGDAQVTIPEKGVEDAIKDAQEAAKKAGTAGDGIAVTMRIALGQTANSLTVTLPQAALEKLVAAQVKELRIESSLIGFCFDLPSLKAMQNAGTGDMVVKAVKQENGKLPAQARQAIGGRTAFDLTARRGGAEVTSFGRGAVSVFLPHTLGKNEAPGALQAVYVDADGKVQWLTGSVYDSVNQVLRFSTNHFSTYGIAHKAAAASFTDTANHWAEESIAFAVTRGLLGGTSATAFNPAKAVTQGELAGALSTFLGKTVQQAFGGRYTAAGTLNREELAAILANCAKTSGYSLPKVYGENLFADREQISSSAKAAVKEMQMAGILAAKDGNRFDPKGTVTRGEAAVMLHRLAARRIAGDSAQGWMRNDSGSWLYYQNGRAVTGEKKVDGITYLFNQYGEIADRPKHLAQGSYTVQKGDSFWRIAKAHNCDMYELARVNNRTISSMLYVGDVLRLPAGR